jgi:AcrR family transcriptional regulator
MGLRERKKEQTRHAIGETARRLFAERGFDAVTVAEVARAADVAEATVFNYFPTKEDLFYSGMVAFEAELVQAVGDRPPGESAIAAFRRFIVAGADRLAAEEVAETISAAGRIVTASPTLLAREREIVERYTEELARVLAEETGAAADDLEPRAAAGALMSAHRALVAQVRGAVLAGTRGPELAALARTQATRAFDVLERGLGGYAVRG